MPKTDPLGEYPLRQAHRGAMHPSRGLVKGSLLHRPPGGGGSPNPPQLPPSPAAAPRGQPASQPAHCLPRYFLPPLPLGARSPAANVKRGTGHSQHVLKVPFLRPFLPFNFLPWVSAPSNPSPPSGGGGKTAISQSPISSPVWKEVCGGGAGMARAARRPACRRHPSRLVRRSHFLGAVCCVRVVGVHVCMCV